MIVYGKFQGYVGTFFMHKNNITLKQWNPMQKIFYSRNYFGFHESKPTCVQVLMWNI